jgi:thiol-disulfide isomerase/thioredoxin
MVGRGLLVAAAIACAGFTASEGAGLIGTRAPELRGLHWIQGGPVTLAGARGRPVLIRFWTDGCSLCRASAPAFNRLHKQYGPRGLLVLGVHHPKSDEGRRVETVRAAVRELGFAFPVATDPEWATVKAFGVGSRFQSFTSVSVLVDGEGVIRWVHDGGELHLDDPAGRSLVDRLDRMLPRR